MPLTPLAYLMPQKKARRTPKLKCQRAFDFNRGMNTAVPWGRGIRNGWLTGDTSAYREACKKAWAGERTSVDTK